MAEASENLKKQMAAHPEIAKLAEQKLAMRAALIKAGVDEESTTDFTKYADLLRSLGFSIDSTIEANGYTYNYGTEESPITLSSCMADMLKANEALATMESYKSRDFYNDSSIMYLTVKPLSSDMSYFCSGAKNLRYVPQLDFSGVKNLQRIFSSTTSSNFIVYDEYTVDLASCADMSLCSFDFTKKLIIKNMQNDCKMAMFGYGWSNVESIEGINLSANTVRVHVFVRRDKTICVPHVEQSDDSVIRCANVVSTLYDEPTEADSTFDQFDDETLYGFCTHAYDWTTNPRNYTKIAGGTSNDSYCTNYYCYHFGDAVKARLAAAYPDVDFTKMMEDKGWTY
jgi:hypothetical protein